MRAEREATGEKEEDKENGERHKRAVGNEDKGKGHLYTNGRDETLTWYAD